MRKVDSGSSGSRSNPKQGYTFASESSHSVECYSVDKVEYIRNMTYGVLFDDIVSVTGYNAVPRYSKKFQGSSPDL
ncbi:predicted protein [Sclerotinia sclerotiorum 1980 UF-70]|uniref:Uncharacterized protein n=1 Tax=Sclerotinia sclerotiorum (strain ATCC 18683 / 1980 / Ss-1) TaxID=665079 RepID=A7E5S2_SCLS1|nr:predicted protein [Sclerotinia sclerotiorum 1980 UF-70]EDN91244.1 predicted protein [Sclerotinia sclerotiorum 1980 UF-70]